MIRNNGNGAAAAPAAAPRRRPSPRSAITAWRSNTFAAMENPHFRLLFIGSLFATFAYMMMFLAMGVVSYDLSGNNTAVGIVGGGVGLAMLLAPFGGVIADRVDRKWLIVFGQGGGAAMLTVTGILLLFDAMTLPLLFGLMMFLGFTFVLMGPARNAFTADLVGPRLVGNAVVLSQLAHTLGQPLSPYVAAMVLDSSAGAGGTYVLMGALVSIGVFTVAAMPNRKRARTPAEAKADADPSRRRGVIADLADGARYVLRRPSLRLMLMIFVSTVVIGFLFRVLTPALLDQHLGRDPTDMGGLFLVNGIAAAVVSIFVAGAATTRWAWPTVLGSIVLLGFGYLVLASAQSYGQAMAAMALLGPGLQAPVMVLQARIMMFTESAYYGRVMAFTMMSWGVQMLFGIPAGIAADALGEREVLGAMGLLAFILAALATFGWLAVRKHEVGILANLAQIAKQPMRPATPPAVAAANGANGTNGGGAMPLAPSPMMRPVALMSGQKLRV